MRIVMKQCGENVVEKTFNGNAKELLKLLEINSETVLVVKNKELVDLDEVLKDSDEVEILSVVSGG
jgi:sulfur carrier protein ThiS